MRRDLGQPLVYSLCSLFCVCGVAPPPPPTVVHHHDARVGQAASLEHVVGVVHVRLVTVVAPAPRTCDERFNKYHSGIWRSSDTRGTCRVTTESCCFFLGQAFFPICLGAGQKVPVLGKRRTSDEKGPLVAQLQLVDGSGGGAVELCDGWRERERDARAREFVSVRRSATLFVYKRRDKGCFQFLSLLFLFPRKGRKK